MIPYSFRARIMFRRSSTNSSSNHGFLTSNGWLRGEVPAGVAINLGAFFLAVSGIIATLGIAFGG
jgi:hypothetical protein